MDQTSVIVNWIKAVNAFAELLTYLSFAGGILAIAMCFNRVRKLSSQGAMQSMVQYTPKSVFILFCVGGFCIYLGSTIQALDETIFLGVNAVSGGDPLSWRADDTVSTSGGPEALVMMLIKRVIQVFGLAGIVNALREMAKMSNPARSNANESGIGTVVAFAFGGIALLRIDKSVAVLAEMLPYFDGLAKAFSI